MHPHASASKVPERVGVSPRPGLALVFDHNLCHEGATLLEGVKYAIRTDVMFTRRRSEEQQRHEGNEPEANERVQHDGMSSRRSVSKCLQDLTT